MKKAYCGMNCECCVELPHRCSAAAQQPESHYGQVNLMIVYVQFMFAVS